VNGFIWNELYFEILISLTLRNLCLVEGTYGWTDRLYLYKLEFRCLCLDSSHSHSLCSMRPKTNSMDSVLEKLIKTFPTFYVTKSFTTMKITEFLDETPCSLVGYYPRYDGSFCFHISPIMKMEVAGSFKTSVTIWQTIRCHTPEGSIVHTHNRDNLKSSIPSIHKNVPLNPIVTCKNPIYVLTYFRIHVNTVPCLGRSISFRFACQNFVWIPSALLHVLQALIVSSSLVSSP
jgi:hypothetical protein